MDSKPLTSSATRPIIRLSLAEIRHDVSIARLLNEVPRPRNCSEFFVTETPEMDMVAVTSERDGVPCREIRIHTVLHGTCPPSPTTAIPHRKP